MHGRVQTTVLPAPAAGSDWAVTLSQADRVQVHAITAQLTTSATAASRLVTLQLSDQNGLVYWAADLEAAQVASGTARYSWARGTSVSANTALGAPVSLSGSLPYAWLEPGDQIAVKTTNLESGDQWSQVVMRYSAVEHWQYLQALERLREALGG